MTGKKIDILIDAFWSGVDWVGNINSRMEKSREQAAERRRRRALGLNPLAPGGAESTAISSTSSAVGLLPESEQELIDESAETSSPIPERKPRRFAITIKLPRFRRNPAPPKTLCCPSCGHAQYPPALFCEACHESFLQVSKFLMLLMVTIAIGCFFSTEYFRESLEWPWPLYLFYALVFLVVNAVMMRGAWRIGVAVFLWGFCFMAGGLFVYVMGAPVARDFVLSSVQSFGTFLVENPIALVPFLSGMLLALLILLIWMTRRYTFAHSYRILFIALAALALGSKYLYLWLLKNEPIAKSLSFLDEDTTLEILDLTSVNVLRVLAAEIVVYAMVISSRPASELFAARKTRPRPLRRATARSPMDHLADAFYSLSITLVNGVTRAYMQIGYGGKVLVMTLRDLALHSLDFLWILTRDLFVPIASLTAAVVVIHHLALDTGAYIAERRYQPLLQLAAAAVFLFFSQLFFLASKSRVHLFKLLTSNVYLTLWFAPYLLTLFIFVSFSLYAVGLVLIRWNEQLEYHFRLGGLTLGAFLLTLLALIFAILKRHREGESENET